jgi:hypothetical protein
VPYPEAMDEGRQTGRSKTDAEFLERCVGLLSQAEELLSTDLTPADRSHGWTIPKREQLRRIVEEWKAEVLAATTTEEVRTKILGRWFLENGVDYGPSSELLAETDNAITDYKEEPWEDQMVAPSPEVSTGSRHSSPSFDLQRIVFEPLVELHVGTTWSLRHASGDATNADE